MLRLTLEQNGILKILIFPRNGAGHECNVAFGGF